MRVGKRYLLAATAAVAAMGVVGSAQAQSGAPIKIGLSGPFTGGSASMGVSMRDGVKLAIAEINKAGGVLGRPLLAIERDDEARNELGVQIAHPDALVIDIAGDASVQMTMQEMSAAVQHDAPIKIFILNNQYMGMVRQWQQLLHGNRISESYTAAMPDFVKLAEAYGGIGIKCDKPTDLDDAIMAMLKAPADKPVLFDCRVAALANCFPMIPSGKAHHEMLLGDNVTDEDIETLTKALGPLERLAEA